MTIRTPKLDPSTRIYPIRNVVGTVVLDDPHTAAEIYQVAVDLNGVIWIDVKSTRTIQYS